MRGTGWKNRGQKERGANTGTMKEQRKGWCNCTCKQRWRKKENKELVWAGSTWMIGCAVTMPVTEKSVCVIIAYL